jgi:hypothetical protein
MARRTSSSDRVAEGAAADGIHRLNLENKSHKAR